MPFSRQSLVQADTAHSDEGGECCHVPCPSNGSEGMADMWTESILGCTEATQRAEFPSARPERECLARVFDSRA